MGTICNVVKGKLTELVFEPETVSIHPNHDDIISITV